MKPLFSKPPVNRLGWLDAARGFIVFYMVFTLITPGDWFKFSAITEFMFVHPSRLPGNWRLIDLGAPAFVLILGLLLGVTFQKRKERDGTGKAVLHILARYALILLLGIILIWATYDGFIYDTKDDWLAYINPGTDVQITVVANDVIFLLGFVGWIALPFLFLKKGVRMIAGYCLFLTFQVLCLFNDYTKVINVTVSSVHSGIYGAVFGYGPITIIGSCLGEYLILSPEEKKKQLYRNLSIFGVINTAVGFLLLPWPLTFYPALLYIAVGMTTLGILLFIFLYTRMHLKMHLLRGYGENTFLIYIITVIPWEIAYLIIDKPHTFEWGLFIALFIFWLFLNGLILFLHFKKIKIKTEMISLIAILVVIILAVILMQLGML